MAKQVTAETFTYNEGELKSAFALSTKNIIKFGDTDIFPFPYIHC